MQNLFRSIEILKYIRDKIDNKEIEDKYSIHEIGYYIEKFIKAGWIEALDHNWAVKNGKPRSEYNNTYFSVLYEKLKITESGKVMLKD